MMPMSRLAVPVLLAALFVAHAGCGSGPIVPTGPRPQDSGDQGRAAALDQSKPAVPAAVAPPLGAASGFAVLGSSTVTNTGATIVNGDLGVSPGTAITGFPPGTVNGVIHSADAVALAGQNAITTAYNTLAGQACDTVLTGQNLGGLTLTPGAYCFTSSAQLTGTLTLNGQGDPNAVWVFQIGSTLTTASGSRVAFINSGRACGAFWQVGSSATIGTSTVFRGNILALASITLDTSATSNGGLFARNGAVTLDGNVVSRVGNCPAVGPSPSPSPGPSSSPGPSPSPGPSGSPGPTPTPPPPPGPVPALPDAAVWGLLAILLAAGMWLLTQR